MRHTPIFRQRHNLLGNKMELESYFELGYHGQGEVHYAKSRKAFKCCEFKNYEIKLKLTCCCFVARDVKWYPTTL